MNFSRVYIEQREAAVREGMQQVMQLGWQEVMQLGRSTERRATILNLLKFRFGSLDDELLAIIKPLMELPPEEFTPTLMQSSRSELLARFGKIRGLTEV